jgi:hypothetical protein
MSSSERQNCMDVKSVLKDGLDRPERERVFSPPLLPDDLFLVDDVVLGLS